MPSDISPMMGWLAKKLIVPEANRSISEQLTCRHPKSWIPDRIMKCRCQPPMPQGMKKNLIWITGFIAVKLMEKMMQGMSWIHHFVKRRFQRFDLRLVKHFDIGQITILMERFDLLLTESVLIPIGLAIGLREKCGY
jgi:hypothetical protein